MQAEAPLLGVVPNVTLASWRLLRNVHSKTPMHFVVHNSASTGYDPRHGNTLTSAGANKLLGTTFINLRLRIVCLHFLILVWRE
jgi:hypothetical protein